LNGSTFRLLPDVRHSSDFGSLTLCGTSGTCAIAARKTSANHLGRRSKSHPGARPSSAGANNGRVCARRSQLLDLLAENDRLNVYAGELEVRPPCAPTTEPHEEAIDRL